MFSKVALSAPIARRIVLGGFTVHKQIAASRVPEPDLKNAERLRFDLTAGHVSPELDAYLKENNIGLDQLCLPQRTFWAINGKSWSGQDHQLKPPPLAELKLGRSYIFELFNGTPHPHPIHLHGHVFRVITRDGKPTRYREWLDTVLLDPRTRAEIAFVADNPGSWMLHCHVLEHQASGMMAVLRVA